MKLESYRKMSERKLNEKVALSCGYLRLNTKDLVESLKKIGQSVPHIEEQCYWVNQAGQIVSVPDYCKDLNAMHEAEKMLWRPGMAWNDYAATLRSVTDGRFEITDIDVRPIFATARERAEAFVATMDVRKGADDGCEKRSGRRMRGSQKKALLVRAMTNERLRQEVAGLLGWSRPTNVVNEFWDKANPLEFCPPGALTYYGNARTVPDWTGDLNAMQDAVSDVVRREGSAFYVAFDSSLADVLERHDHVEHEMVHATARQRAEAFVMAMEAVNKRMKGRKS